MLIQNYWNAPHDSGSLMRQNYIQYYLFKGVDMKIAGVKHVAGAGGNGQKFSGSGIKKTAESRTFWAIKKSRPDAFL